MFNFKKLNPILLCHSLFCSSLTTLLMAAACVAAPLGGMDSGGGNVVICFTDPAVPEKIRANGGAIHSQFLTSDSLEKIEAFDLYDAKKRRGFDRKERKIFPIRKGEGFRSYLDRTITRMENSIPAIGAMLRKSQQLFDEKNIFIEDFGVQSIKDVDAVGSIDSDRCVLTTAAVQSRIDNSYFLHLDERLFFHPKHNELSKAVLILHEYIYRKGRDLGHIRSKKTRLLLAKVISEEPETLIDLVHLARSLGFIGDMFGEFYDFFYLKPYEDLLEITGPSSHFVDSDRLWQVWDIIAPFRYFRDQIKINDQTGYLQRIRDFFEEIFPDLDSNYVKHNFHLLVKEHYYPDNLSEAVAYLNTLSSSHYLKRLSQDNQKKFWEYKEKLDIGQKERAEFIRDELTKKGETLSKKLDSYSYLTDSEKEELKNIQWYVVDLFYKLALKSHTKEEIALLDSAEIRFSPFHGVYNIEDLYFDIGPFAKEEEKATNKRRIQNWIYANIREQIFFKVNARPHKITLENK